MPCAILVDAGKNCGKPANAGLCFPLNNGTYIMLPVCKECSDRWYQSYFNSVVVEDCTE